MAEAGHGSHGGRALQGGEEQDGPHDLLPTAVFEGEHTPPLSLGNLVDKWYWLGEVCLGIGSTFGKAGPPFWSTILRRESKQPRKQVGPHCLLFTAVPEGQRTGLHHWDSGSQLMLSLFTADVE